MEITGRLVADATVRTTKNEKQVTGFRVAINRRYKSGGEQKEQTTYINCSFWRTTALAPYLTKGLLVQVYGNISTHAWVTSDGELKADLDFHCNEITLLGASRKPEGGKPYNDGAQSFLRRQE